MELDAAEDPQQAVEDFLVQAGATNVSVYEGRTAIAGARVEFKVFEPDHVSEETPIHIRNGFFGAGPAYFGLAAALAKRGRRTVVSECVRDQFGLGTFALNPLRLPAQAGYGVIKYTNAIFGTRQADIIGHSMGGPTTTQLALRHPGMIRAISYTGPAGQDGRNQIPYRLKSAVKVLGDEVVTNSVKLRQEYDPERSMVVDAIGYGARFIRTAREAIAVARVDDAEHIRALHRLGIRIGAVLMEHDGFFNPTDIQITMRGAYDAIHIIPDAIHIDPNINPDSHAQTQLEMFATLNQDVRVYQAS